MNRKIVFNSIALALFVITAIVLAFVLGDNTLPLLGSATGEPTWPTRVG
jgi:hypothetical protein